MAEAITRIDARTLGSLPFRTVVNPRENVSAITLLGGKQLNVIPSAKKDDTEIEKDQENQPHLR